MRYINLHLFETRPERFNELHGDSGTFHIFSLKPIIIDIQLLIPTFIVGNGIVRTWVDARNKSCTFHDHNRYAMIKHQFKVFIMYYRMFTTNTKIFFLNRRDPEPETINPIYEKLNLYMREFIQNRSRKLGISTQIFGKGFPCTASCATRTFQ